MQRYSLTKQGQLDRLQFDEKRHRYSYSSARVPGVTSIIEDGLQIYAGIPIHFLEEARERGKVVHARTEHIDYWESRGEAYVPMPAGEYVGYEQAWQAFKQDKGFQVIWVEELVFHTKYLFAGTLDRVGILDGRLVVIDLKTGVLKPEFALQTAGYKAAYNEHLLPGFEKVTGRYALQLRNDGRYTLEEHTDAADFDAFLAALTLYNWKGKHIGE